MEASIVGALTSLVRVAYSGARMRRSPEANDSRGPISVGQTNLQQVHLSRPDRLIGGGRAIRRRCSDNCQTSHCEFAVLITVS
jgi:hypothetical protein